MTVLRMRGELPLSYSGQLREAVETYSHAIELEPTDLLSRSGHGQLLADLDETDKAIEDLDVALRIVESAPRPNAANISLRTFPFLFSVFPFLCGCQPQQAG